MPNVTSALNRSATPRRRRHQRRRQHERTIRVPRLQQAFSTRQFAKRPRRYQVVDDVDLCYESCQDQGIQFDPQTNIGSLRNPPANLFSILDDNEPAPHLTSPISPTCGNFNFTFREPCSHKIEEERTSHLDESTEIQQFHSPPKPLPPILRRRWCSKCDTSQDGITPETQSSPKTSNETDLRTTPRISASVFPQSISSTPFSHPHFNLPRSFSTPTYCDSPSICASSTASNTGCLFLDAFQIPSPLLYHKESREALPGIDDEELDLAKTFATECGQDLPDPDFKSYRIGLERDINQHRLEEEEKALNHKELSFVPAALPATDSRLIGLGKKDKPVPSFNEITSSSKGITCKSSSVLTNTNALAKLVPPTTYIYPGGHTQSSPVILPSTHGPVYDPSSVGIWKDPTVIPISTNNSICDDYELIFPKLPTTDACTTVSLRQKKATDRLFDLDLACFATKNMSSILRRKSDSLLNGSLHNNSMSYIEDKDRETNRLWAVFEKSLLTPKKGVVSKSDTTGIFGGVKDAVAKRDRFSPLTPTPMDFQNGKILKMQPSRPISKLIPLFSFCAPKAPTFTTVDVLATCRERYIDPIPVKLYERQYIGWPRRRRSEAQYESESYDTVCASLALTDSGRKVAQAIDSITGELLLVAEPESYCKSPGWAPESQQDVYQAWLFDEGDWDGNLFDKITVEEVAGIGDAKREELGYCGDKFQLDAKGEDWGLMPTSPVSEDEGYYSHTNQSSENDCEDEWSDWDWNDGVDGDAEVGCDVNDKQKEVGEKE